MKSNPRKKGEKSSSRKRGKKLNAEKRGELAPLRLPEKLKQIRENVPGLTQGKMLLFINPKEILERNRARVSQYERGLRVPSLIELYNYAKFAGVSAEALLDDAIDLPADIRNSLDGLDGLEKPQSETAENENAKTEKVNLIDNAVAVENGESENLSLQVFDGEDENSEKQPELNIGGTADEMTEKKDSSPETSSAAEVLPDAAAGSDEPPLDDARFQEEDTVAASASGIIADYVAVAALVTDSNTIYSAIVPDPIATIISIQLSGEILNDSKIVYLESLGKLRFEEMGRLTTRQFLEQAIAAAFDDYRAHGTASALARRLRLFVGEDE